jgi:taurine--2-oxoglutarate transaminase
MIDPKTIPTDKDNLNSYEIEHIFHPWSYQPAGPPLRVVSANGIRFTTDDGRERIDFSSCFADHNIGHQDPRVIRALCDQARQLCSFAPNMANEPRAVLAKVLAEITPGDLTRTFFSLSGTEAVEVAIKMCHQFTGRRKIISRYRSFHGASSTSMTVSAGDPRSWFQVHGGTDLVAVPLPYCYRCMFGQKYPECDLRCVTYIDQVIELEGGGDKIAGIIFEPVTGPHGIIVPPPDYFPKLREVCDKWGVLMIADEVMSGFGRTGKWFAMEHWNVVPDIMVMAKGLSCGYVPLGATMVRKYISDQFKEQFFGYGASYGGHALGCATSLAVIQVYHDDNLIENSAKMGEYLLEKAKELQDKHSCIGDVRGLGLFVGLELVKNRETREPLIPIAAKVLPGTNPKLEVAKKLAEMGLMAMTANPSNTIGLSPPLIITKDEIDESMAIIDKALAAADAYTE